MLLQLNSVSLHSIRVFTLPQLLLWNRCHRKQCYSDIFLNGTLEEMHSLLSTDLGSKQEDFFLGIPQKKREGLEFSHHSVSLYSLSAKIIKPPTTTIPNPSFSSHICQGHRLVLLLTVCKLKPSSIIRVTAHFTPRKGPLLHQHGDSLRFQHASLITSKQSCRREVIHLVFECTPPLLIPRSIPEVCVSFTLKLRSDAVTDFFRIHKLALFWRCPLLQTNLCKTDQINVNNWPHNCAERL